MSEQQQQNQGAPEAAAPEILDPASLLSLLTPENVAAVGLGLAELKEAIADIPAQLEFSSKVNLAKSFMRQVTAANGDWHVDFDDEGFYRAWAALQADEEEEIPTSAAPTGQESDPQ